MSARILLVALALTVSACVDADAPIDAADTATFVFEVPKGSTAGGIGPALIDEGFVGSELQWKLFLRQTDASCLKAGRFKLSRSMSLNEVVDTLCGTPLADDVPFTVVEGWRIRDIDKALTEKGWIEAGAYTTLAMNKGVEAPFEITGTTYEGYLYPETYNVSAGNFSAEKLITRQLTTFQERFLASNPDLGERTLDEVVIMASMLEREEPKPENRNLVAGILWKRIDRDTPLGVDATSRYELENWNDRKAFIKRLKDPNDAYNSREKKGLPPTAIGNPTVSSLNAAINPTKSAYWYYLHDGQQNLHPARNAVEHEANRAKYGVY